MTTLVQQPQRKSMYPMIEMKEALITVRNAAQQHSSGTVTIKLTEANGYICAENVFSPENFPRFPTSVMDGYAVRAPLIPGDYTVKQHLFAGDAMDTTVPTDNCGNNQDQEQGVAYITTGSRVPVWATGVVKVEDTRPAVSTSTATTVVTTADTIAGTAGAANAIEEVKVHIAVACTPGMFIRPIGSDIKLGSLLLARGARITPVEMALLATVGITHVTVWAHPRVGVMSTGNELVEHDDNNSLSSFTGKDNANSSLIRDTNRVALLASLAADNGLPVSCLVDCGIVRDSRVELEAAFRRAIAECDVVLTTGGVSMGAADLVKPLLAELGTVHFGRLNMKPGKPCTFATAVRPNGRSCFLFGLPGNPVSALVCKTLLVDPLIQTLQQGGSATAVTTVESFGVASAVGTTATTSTPAAAAAAEYTEYACEASVELADLVVRMDPERPEYHRCCVWLQTDDCDNSSSSSAGPGAGAGAGGGQHRSKGRLVAYSTGAQQSSRVLSLQAANALLKVPAGTGVLRRGDLCPAILLGLPRSVSVDEKAVAAAAATATETEMVHPSGCACCRNSVMQDYYARVVPAPMPATKLTATATAPAAGGAAGGVGSVQSTSSTPKPHTGNAPKTVKMAVRVGVLTVSDRASEGVYADTSGPEVARLLSAMTAGLDAKGNPIPNAGGGGGEGGGFYPLDFIIAQTACVPDNRDRIQETLRSWCGNVGGVGALVDVVFTTGGTGFGLKDYTPEAVRPLLTREAPGISQALLAEGLKHTPLALLSRPVVGVRHQALVATLPGSVKAIRENIVVLRDLLPRIMELLLRNECT